MAVIETSISINQPVEKLFAHVTDIKKQKDGIPSITAIEMGGKVALPALCGRHTCVLA